jgi:acyl-coenzyme A synthetase/AMP-(fatty) acid ligase
MALRDEVGYYKLLGRVDDVLLFQDIILERPQSKVINEHPAVAEECRQQVSMMIRKCNVRLCVQWRNKVENLANEINVRCPLLNWYVDKSSSCGIAKTFWKKINGRFVVLEICVIHQLCYQKS